MTRPLALTLALCTALLLGYGVGHYHGRIPKRGSIDACANVCVQNRCEGAEWNYAEQRCECLCKDPVPGWRIVGMGRCTP